MDGLRIPKLLPAPKSALWGDGFLPWQKAEFEMDAEGFPRGAFLKLSFGDGIRHPQGYSIKVNPDGISVECRSPEGARNAAQTLKQIGMQSDDRGFRFVEISDWPDLETRGFMLDISRCKVPTMEELVLLVDRLALFKYNRLELYTEHTYAFEGHELVWADASPMTPRQYEHLNGLCAAVGIELVANMNGLGHMERWLRYPEYKHLAESEAPFVDPLGTVRVFPTTLYPDENALAFMDSLYGQFLPNFASDKINIGGDEPWELGMGRSRERAEKVGKYQIYLEHILGLNELCKKRGKKVFFWADVLMQKPEYSEKLPEDMTPILWGYYLDHPYEEQCSSMKKLGRKFLVAPGTSTWNSFGSRWDCARQNIITACECAKKYGALGSMLTQWGDNGNHQPWCAMYPAIAHHAACAWGEVPTEEQVCNALDRLVFFDSTGEFSRSLVALGRTDPVQKLFSFHHKMFFATPAGAEKLVRENPGYDLGAMESAVDFALALAATSKPESRDGRISMEEVALAGMMTRWALKRARGDFDTETTGQKADLKFIASEYGRVWLSRARFGGLAESLGLIRGVKPELFKSQWIPQS